MVLTFLHYRHPFKAISKTLHTVMTRGRLSLAIPATFLLSAMLLLLGTLLVSACATPPSTERVQLEAGNYVLDPTHARINWSLSHAGLSEYTARFDTVSGTLQFDPDNPENSQVDIRIDPKSVSTGLAEFDKTLAGDKKYFDAETYPEIRFQLTDIVITSDRTGDLIGNLSLRGVTKPLTLKTTFNGAGKSFGHKGKTLGFSAIGQLTRSDFGMTYLTNFGIGDIVTLRIEAEFNPVL